MSEPTNRLSPSAPPSSSNASRVEDYHAAGAAAAIELSAGATEASTPFVGQWRTLVSTTNWEKGRIVCEWRKSLEADGATASEYSDDAWAQLVGGVTGQHVGRLRRVYQRFGEVYNEYAGLYWSHFQAACEWDDAEMWLEGALQNGWSVSQVRAKRWETVGDGKPAPETPAEPATADEDFADESSSSATTVGESAPIRDAADGDETAAAAERRDRAEDDAGDDEFGDAAAEDSSDAPAAEPIRPFAELPELPDDVADAFEQFKLVILNHKLAGWSDVSRADLVGALESLKQLAMAPADND